MKSKKLKSVDTTGNSVLTASGFELFKKDAKRKLKSPSFWGSKALRIGMYILLIGIAFIFVYPFIFMAVTSLKTNADLLDPTIGWIPKNLKFKNYEMAWTFMAVPKYALNSIIVTVVCTIGHLLSCTFIGYGLARYKFKGRGLLFFLVILTIIIPTQTLLIPNFINFANMGWLDSMLPILVPPFFGLGLKGGLYVFLARQFLISLPKEMEEAARIDGCNFISTFFRIVVPIVRPLLLVMLVLSIVWHWNDYYEPMFYFKADQLPLPTRLNSVIEMSKWTYEDYLLRFPGINLDPEDIINSAVVMAGCAIVISVPLVVFSVLQRWFIQGVERTGLVE